MKHVMTHNLSQDVARKTADCAFEAYKERYARFCPILRWDSERRAQLSFSAKGVELCGIIELAQETIAVDVKVPLLLRPFQKRAISIIERELQYWIERARTNRL